MLRWFIVDEACDVDVGVYEVYPIGRVFSVFVHSDLEILPGDFVLVEFELYSARVVKLVRNGVVVYESKTSF